MADAPSSDPAVVRVEEKGDEWQVTLNVGVQHFDVGPRYETEDEAEWMSEQLARAICKLLKHFGVQGDMMDVTRTH